MPKKKKLKPYGAAQQDKLPNPLSPTPSGIACQESRCSGEMMYANPAQIHPEMPELKRAVCGACGWRGWC